MSINQPSFTQRHNRPESPCMCFLLNHRQKAAQASLCAEGKAPAALQDTYPNREDDNPQNTQDLSPLKVMQ